MRLNAEIKVLSDIEIEIIIDSAMQILLNTGISIENDEILIKLSEFGGIADLNKRNIKFDKSFVRRFIDESQRVSWADNISKFTAGVEIFKGYYLDPADEEYKEWTIPRFMDYIKLAKGLPNIDRIWMLGCPLTGIPMNLQPLYEKLYCWKYGLTGGNSIWDTALCPKIFYMWEVFAEETGKNISELYNGTVYLISPLTFAKEEADQFVWFYKKGLATTVGTLGSLGGTAPVTIAGALALHIAENLFINILNRAFFGTKTLHFVSYMSALDMSTAAFQYGRPEQPLFNIACAQIAKSLGTSFEGHCGLSDAKVPGHEAGVQKLSSALFNAMACGTGYIAAGLLGVDEIFSPVQMILDNEITGYLNRITAGFDVNVESLASDVIGEVGTGGTFLDTDHTALNFRESLWLPSIWSKEMLSPWLNKNSKTDIDMAKEKYFNVISNNDDLKTYISENAENELLKIIN